MTIIQYFSDDELDSILEHPKTYRTEGYRIDSYNDIPLIKLTDDKGENPQWIMIGKDEDEGEVYLVWEDNDTSSDYYLEDGDNEFGAKTLKELYDILFKEAKKLIQK